MTDRYESGYVDGESSMHADFTNALDEVLPFSFEGPRDLAKKLEAHLKQLTISGLPVAGYRPQSDAAIALVNDFKADEERLLRKLDNLADDGGPDRTKGLGFTPDYRWIALARTHFQEGFMALNRAVFQPARVKLPEDET